MNTPPPQQPSKMASTEYPEESLQGLLNSQKGQENNPSIKGSFKQASATGEDFRQQDPEVAQLSELVKSLLAE